MQVVPVILCGGSGTRLWPLSRDSYPKQFLKLAGELSLFQATLERLRPLTDVAPMIVTNEQHRFLVAEQAHQIGIRDAEIILEPKAKNTAPAIAVAALRALRRHPDTDPPVMVVLPSDHLMRAPAEFIDAVRAAIETAAGGDLVTFGIVPRGPETGFGYIKAATQDASSAPRQVDEFVEKPDLETARRYVDSGDYFWNSGMFLFRADRYLEELSQHSPLILHACRNAVELGIRDLDFFRLDTAAFERSPSDSIDYAVMEKSRRVRMMPLDAGWSDIGSWSALWDVSSSDAQGNSVHGDVITIGSTDSFVHSSHRLVATLGVHDLVVVETPDAVLVAHKSEAQKVKEIVTQLKHRERGEAHFHRKVYRPWGHYDSIDFGPRFQVKRIVVNPGESLSLQMHHHRAEHWIVVKGTAEVTCDAEVRLLSENQSTFIPLGSTHRLANPGKIPLEIIEVQSGSYLGEDDIVRFSDDYGRHQPAEAELTPAEPTATAVAAENK